jgi:hypothetical protein
MYVLDSNSETLIAVSVYTGIPIHDKQDIIINMFEPEKQLDVRSRFLLDTTYFKDVGCRYDITNPLFQPIIEHKRFYNPGYLLINEFNEELKKIYDKTDIISMQKKSFLKGLFDIYTKKYLNQTYCMYRRQCNETLDDYEKKYYREKMLECVNNLMQCFITFIDIDEFINKLRVGSIYYDINEINILTNYFIG